MLTVNSQQSTVSRGSGWCGPALLTVNSQQSTVNSQQSTVNSEFTIPMKTGFDITGAARPKGDRY
ncbi:MULTISPECIES: hypothetical protein [unclassified Microcoleus]|uniref:hypothetical protein n=1 Tax=unclassified Microcoleus TaxID=2642155 RepID=UPI002FD04CDC